MSESTESVIKWILVVIAIISVVAIISYAAIRADDNFKALRLDCQSKRGAWVNQTCIFGGVQQ